MLFGNFRKTNQIHRNFTSIVSILITAAIFITLIAGGMTASAEETGDTVPEICIDGAENIIQEQDAVPDQYAEYEPVDTGTGIEPEYITPAPAADIPAAEVINDVAQVEDIPAAEEISYPADTADSAAADMENYLPDVTEAIEYKESDPENEVTVPVSDPGNTEASENEAPADEVIDAEAPDNEAPDNEELTVQEYNEETAAERVLLNAPSGLNTKVTKGKLVISWNKVAGAAGYIVYRWIEGGEWTAVRKTKNTSYTDTTAVSGVVYNYSVQPYYLLDGVPQYGDYDINGVSGMILATPGGLGVKSLRSGHTIWWNPVNGADGYRVYRKVKGGEWVCIALTDTAYYKDTASVPGVVYYYTVRAYAYDQANDRWVVSWFQSPGAKAVCNLRVLMIGNSLTKYDSTSSCISMIKSIASLNGKNISVTGCVYGGASLSDFTGGRYRSVLISKLSARKYDVIVIQEASEIVVQNSSRYLNNIDALMKLLSAYGQASAKIVLYSVNGCTHVSGYSYYSYEQITFANVTLASRRIQKNYSGSNVVIAKAGEMHLQTTIAYPGLALMRIDGNHPTYTGYYISSIKLYESITGTKATKVAGGMTTYLKFAHRNMTISKNTATVSVGKKLKLTVSDPTGGRITWTSYNSSVASVSSGGVVTGRKKGTAVIMAQSSSGLQVTCVVTVK